MGILKLIKDLCCCCMSSSEGEEGFQVDNSATEKRHQSLSYDGIGRETSERQPPDLYSPDSYTIVITGSPQIRKKSGKDTYSGATDTTPLLAESHLSPKVDNKGKTQSGFTTPPPRQGVKIPKTPQSTGSDLSFAGTPSP